MVSTSERLILASASPARAQLLAAAGVHFSVEPAGIDEGRIKRMARQAGHSALVCAGTIAAGATKSYQVRVTVPAVDVRNLEAEPAQTSPRRAVHLAQLLTE